MLLHKWENVLIFLFFIPPLFVLFIVVFPCLWSLAFYFVKFLEIKNIYKILIIFSILNLILFSAYYTYYFTEIGWLFGPLFAAGLVKDTGFVRDFKPELSKEIESFYASYKDMTSKAEQISATDELVELWAKSAKQYKKLDNPMQKVSV